MVALINKFKLNQGNICGLMQLRNEHIDPRFKVKLSDFSLAVLDERTMFSVDQNGKSGSNYS